LGHQHTAAKRGKKKKGAPCASMRKKKKKRTERSGKGGGRIESYLKGGEIKLLNGGGRAGLTHLRKEER